MRINKLIPVFFAKVIADIFLRLTIIFIEVLPNTSSRPARSGTQ